MSDLTTHLKNTRKSVIYEKETGVFTVFLADNARNIQFKGKLLGAVTVYNKSKKTLFIGTESAPLKTKLFAYTEYAIYLMNFEHETADFGPPSGALPRISPFFCLKIYFTETGERLSIETKMSSEEDTVFQFFGKSKTAIELYEQTGINFHIRRIY